MKKLALFLITVSFSFQPFAQTNSGDYKTLAGEALSLYYSKNYKESGMKYNEAFRRNGDKALVDDRYNAACSWALAGFADSAFVQLDRIAGKAKYDDYDHITSDADLNSLHADRRWLPLMDKVSANKEEAERNLNKPLVHQLDSLYRRDQDNRLAMDTVESKYGQNSREWNALMEKMHTDDSVNVVAVTQILDKYGWLGTDVVGQRGSTTLWLVIQHASLQTQEKYLPLLRQAVKDKKAQASELAMLEDRIEMFNNRPQIYGSQLRMENGKYVLWKIKDEANVNKRRAEVGLPPLEDYLRNWNIDYHVPDK
jgi:hypothetical protein